ncbi:MAG: AAA family ATPase [Solirubrobacterales bacterium]
MSSTLRSFEEIVARPVRWLWRPRVALGKITGLAGRPKVGKGLLCSELIARVTRGELDGDLDCPRDVIVVTTEDEPGDTLKPRLLAAGADLSRVSYFEMGALDAPIPFRVPQHADELARRVAEKQAALVVIDPLIEFVDAKADTHKSQPVRQAIASLNQIARSHGCAIVAIIHLNKSASTDALLRHEASAAFTQIMRATMLLARDPDDPNGEHGDQRVLAVTSSNLAREASSLLFRVEPQTVNGDTGEKIDTARIVHVGESDADGADLLGSIDADARSEHDEAIEFLRSELATGPQPAKKIQDAARDAGIGPGSLKRAKRRLGVGSKKQGMGAGWAWELPLPKESAAKGTGAVPAKESPSSPSHLQAESDTSGQGGSTEGDGSPDVGSLPATEAEEAEIKRIAGKFEGTP